MKHLHYVTTRTLLSWMIERMSLQQQLIEAQEHIIALQKRIDEMTPKNAPDEELLWHLFSKGVSSKEAAESDDLATVRKFLKWNQDFAKKHIKPYVNQKVYMECQHQMTRNLPERVAELETRERLKTIERLRKTQQTAAQN